jgi:hypothetical protein
LTALATVAVYTNKQKTDPVLLHPSDFFANTLKKIGRTLVDPAQQKYF